MTDTKEFEEIKIPKSIIKKIEVRIENESSFKSVSEYIIFVLEEVIKEDVDEQHEKLLSKDDEEKVKERLRSLGYLD